MSAERHSHSLDKCQICGGKESQYVLQKIRGNYASTWVECLNCHSAHIDPYPTRDQLFNYYNSNYVELDLSGTADQGSDHKLHYSADYESTVFQNYTYSLIDSGIKPDEMRSSFEKVLDYGCANGVFLKYLKGQGYKAANIFGADIGEDMLETARSFTPNVCNIDRLTGKYDLITLWNVIEHIHEPRAIVGKLRDLLSVGGEVFIETPVYGELAKTMGKDFAHFLVVEHINLFSRRAIIDMFNDFGFTCLSQSSFGANIPAESNQGFVKSTFDSLSKKNDFGATQVLRFKKSAA